MNRPLLSRRVAASLERLPPNAVTLGVTSLLNDLSSEMIFPLLPAFLTSVLGAGPAFLGVVEGAADSVSSLLRIAFGRLSDRATRRKPLVVAGYAVASLARPFVAAATVPWQVLAVRVTDRVGKGVRTAPRDALLADSAAADVRGRAFGFHRAMDHLGAVIGPLLASVAFVLVGRSYRMLFALASIPGVLAVGFAAARIEDVPPARRGPPAPPAGAGPAFGRGFTGLMTAIFLFALGNSTDAFLLLDLQNAGIALPLLPLLWSALHLVKVATVYPSGALSDRVGRLPLIVAGWLYYAAIYVGFAVFSSPAVLAAMFVAYGAFYGLTEGSERALVSDLVSRSRRGTAFGVYNAIVGVAALPSSVAMGAIWEAYGRTEAFLFGAAMAMVAAAVLIGTALLGRGSGR